MAQRPKLNKRSSSALRKANALKAESLAAKSKKQIEDLTEEVAKLKSELEKISSENEALKCKLKFIVDKLLDCCEENIQEDTNVMNNPLDIPNGVVSDIISSMMAEKLLSKKRLAAGRIEDLETRVTQQSLQVANLLRTKSIIEDGLVELSQCSTIFQVRDKIEDLQYAIQDPAIVCVADKSAPSVCPDHEVINLALDLNGTTSPKPPPRRMPGDTHIRFINRDLRIYLAKNLSLEKSSKQDWRTLAVRLGIPTTLVDEWRGSKLPCPMMQVFSHWSRSDSATVRMLHRHLVSPQMKCLLLAKCISSFYDID